MNVLDTAPAPGTRPGPSRGARRAGFVVGAVVNGVLLWAVDVWPGWQAVPFLTDEFTAVLGLVNLTLAAGLVSQLLYAVLVDRRWLRPAGDVVTTSIGLVATVALLRTFPFAFSGSWSGWDVAARVLLWLGVVGSAIGIVVALVTLLSGRWRTA